MTKTHKKFKSVIPKVKSADGIFKRVGLALIYQHMFDRRTTPLERNQWEEDKLQKFKIDLEKVDRVYYIYNDDGADGQNFTLAGRSDCNGKQIYFELTAGCDFEGFHSQGHGTIFVSLDAKLFMKLILTDSYPTDLIYKSLTEDGIETDELSEYEKCAKKFWTCAPMLKYLCNRTVYEHKESLSHYSDMLPKQLKDSLDEYIRVKEAKDDYDKWTDDESDDNDDSYYGLKYTKHENL